MNMFNKKSLYAALAGMGALGVSAPPRRFNLNPDGLGQVLIYPYYTVRAVPTGIAGTAPRSTRCCRSSTRRHRRRRSRSASSKAGTAVKSSTSTCTCRRRTSGGRRLSRMPPAARRSRDRQVLHAAENSGGGRRRSQALGYADDGAGTSLDRTKEGYIEIIEMATYDDASTTAKNITHKSGVPTIAPPRRTRSVLPKRSRPRRVVRRRDADQRARRLRILGRRRCAGQLLDLTAVHRRRP